MQNYSWVPFRLLDGDLLRILKLRRSVDMLMQSGDLNRFVKVEGNSSGRYSLYYMPPEYGLKEVLACYTDDEVEALIFLDHGVCSAGNFSDRKTPKPTTSTETDNSIPAKDVMEALNRAAELDEGTFSRVINKIRRATLDEHDPNNRKLYNFVDRFKKEFGIKAETKNAGYGYLHDGDNEVRNYRMYLNCDSEVTKQFFIDGKAYKGLKPEYASRFTMNGASNYKPNDAMSDGEIQVEIGLDTIYFDLHVIIDSRTAENDRVRAQRRFNKAYELDEASSDFIKIGNKVYPKDMSTYDADATEKEIADKAKRQYEQDKQAEAEAKRKAMWQNSRDFFEQHGEDIALIRDTMQELIRRRFHGMPAVHLDNLLNYVMKCTTRTLTKMHYHLSSEYNQHNEKMLELVKGIDDRYVAYRGSEELVVGKTYSIGYLDSTFIYIGADAKDAYFFEDYQSVFANIDHSLSIDRFSSGGNEGISVVDRSETEELNLSFEQIFRDYVPSSGNSPVLGGELVRAWNRVLYRYFNDGDMLSDEEPYGGILPGAHFVQRNVSDRHIVDMIQRMYSAEDKEYADLLHKVKDALTDYINKNPQLLKVQNKKDYLDESLTDSVDNKKQTDTDEEDGFIPDDEM